MKEIYRRMVLLAAIALSICCLRWAHIGTVVELRPLDWQEAFNKNESFGLLKDDALDLLISKGFSAYQEELIKDNLVEVTAEKWARFTQKADSFFANKAAVPEWRHRFKNKYSGQGAWFRSNEDPFSEFNSDLKKKSAAFFLHYKNGESSQWFYLKKVEIKQSDFHFGGTFPHYGMPFRLIYPFAHLAWIPVLLGLIFYFVLPWPKFKKEEIHYPLWSMAVSDITTCIFLFTPFFAIPFIGGPVQNFARWFGLCFVMWPISSLALIVLKHTAIDSQFAVCIKEDSFLIRLWSGEYTLKFSEINSVVPVEMRPPKWLVPLLWLGAMLGRGGDSCRMAGQALITSASVSKALKFKLKNGKELSLWFTNQMGNPLMKGIDKLFDFAVNSPLIKLEKDILQIRGFATHNGFSSSESHRAELKGYPLLKLILTPIAVVLVCVFITSFSGFISDPAVKKKEVRSGRRVKKEVSEVTETEELKKRITPEKEIGIFQEPVTASFTGKILLSAENNIYASGSINKTDNTLDVWLSKINLNNMVEWKKTFTGCHPVTFSEKEMDYDNEYINEISFAKDGNILILFNSVLKTRSVCGAVLKKVNLKGETIWTFTENQENVFDGAKAFFENEDGSISLLIKSSATMFSPKEAKYGYRLFSINNKGGKIAEKKLAIEKYNIDISSVSSSASGFVFTGSKEFSGERFRDIVALAIDKDGNEEWFESYEIKGAEKGSVIKPLRSGYLIAGLKGLQSDKSLDPVLIKTDEQGKLLKRKDLEVKGNQSIVAVSEIAADKFLLLCSQLNQYNNAQESLMSVVSMNSSANDIVWSREGELWGDFVLKNDNTLFILTDKEELSDSEYARKTQWLIAVDFKDVF